MDNKQEDGKGEVKMDINRYLKKANGKKWLKRLLTARRNDKEGISWVLEVLRFRVQDSVLNIISLECILVPVT